MENRLLKLIYLIIHVLVNSIESIYYFGLELQEKILYFINYVAKERRKGSSMEEMVLIEQKVQALDKIPQHIAVILHINSEQDVDLSRLSDLISWSLNSGVNFISFFDFKGILKHQLCNDFRETLEKQLKISKNENIVWGPDFYQANGNIGNIKFPHRNGYKKHIIVNLYSSQDGYGMFTHLLTHELSKTPSQQISIELVDEKLKRLFGNIPDPELAIYFGNNTCTSGFLPWHIRLTEFTQISHKLHHLSLDKYFRVLYKYARCEQRFGK